MKEIFGMLAVAGLLLTGCGSSANWEASIPAPVPFSPGKESPLTVKIQEEGKPVKGLQVKAVLEMKKMDHGTIETLFYDAGNGEYKAHVKLPMGGDWVANVTMSDGKQTKEQEVLFKAETSAVQSQPLQEDSEIVAKINGSPITKEDLSFQETLNRIQMILNRESAKHHYTGSELEQFLKYLDSQEQASKNRNTLMTQMIRLRAVALLAKEKGHSASEAEISKEMEKVRNAYVTNPAAAELIKQYGEEKFWNKQQALCEMMVLSNKVQQDVIDKVTKANPNAEQKEINMLAQKKYEALVVSQVGTLKIEVRNG